MFLLPIKNKRAIKNNQGLGNPYTTTRIPVTVLFVYPKLIEALLSIEEDFFKFPLTKEKRKITIYYCPKTSSRNYNPPPLNDSATSTVKKTDSTLYEIQLAMAQATRPIDYYVHFKIYDNHKLNNAEDPVTMFASTMRTLLADIAATVTQARIDNLHKGALLAKKPMVKRQRFQPFCKRQQYTISTDTYSSNTTTALSTSAATIEANSNNITSDC
ncbi:hypothetical protein BB561_004380 [Smittium simulii]|uniref:Uncharacterized protein n=1 Tax=Smittium simulii TaxID=133385 RepID=A0A2T9YGL2_9FUNG|nr:hypothetical protein BB561_004380 [Smittium simulii]